MNPADVLAFLLFLVVSSVSNSIQQTNQQVLPSVGEGITVHAQVLFDHTVKTEDVSKGENARTRSKPTTVDFTDLFQQAQEYFNNQSILIKMKVENAQEKDDIRVSFGKGPALDAVKTLQNLTTYAATQSHGNDTIFYYFTQSEILEETKTGDHVELDLSEKATFKTFCTGSTSAAVVKYYPSGKDRHISVVSATAETFGLRKYHHLTLRDIIILLMTFSTCPRSECWTQCLLK